MRILSDTKFPNLHILSRGNRKPRRHIRLFEKIHAARRTGKSYLACFNKYIKCFRHEFRKEVTSTRTLPDILERKAVFELLRVENLRTHSFLERGTVKAIDGRSLWLDKGSILSLLGESSCGKSVTALSTMRLIPTPPGKIVDGKTMFEGENLLKKSEDAMMFQDPTAALNPVYTVGDQIAEAIKLHQRLTKAEAIERVIEMLEALGIPSAEGRIHEYPHQFSGGMPSSNDCYGSLIARITIFVRMSQR